MPSAPPTSVVSHDITAQTESASSLSYNTALQPKNTAPRASLDATKKILATGAAIFSALSYGVSIPLSKLFTEGVSPSVASCLLYLGAGLCASIVWINHHRQTKSTPPDKDVCPLQLRSAPLILLMLALNAASILALMAGVALADAASASLLGNFEVAATALIARLYFRESMGLRMWCAVVFITVAGFLLSWKGSPTALFSPGSLLILLACVFWGLENNCTRALSKYDVAAITTIKGLGTSALCFIIALMTHTLHALPHTIIPLLALGVVAYGIGIMLYIWAQRYLGAARVGNYYSLAPFIGVAVSWIIFGSSNSPTFIPALFLTGFGVILTIISTPYTAKQAREA